jgi:hypothetical protein
MRFRARLLPVALLVTCTAVAGAAELVVTSLADSGEGSLRAAIEHAGRTPEADTIVLDVDGVVHLESTLPEISTEIAIVGHGWSRTAVEGADAKEGRPAVRPFVIAPSGDLVLDGVMVRSSVPIAEGGAVLNRGGRLTYRDSSRPPADLGYGGTPRFEFGQAPRQRP